MAGMMKKLSNNSSCVFTGKGLAFGGSLMRPEATGYGTVYFAQEMLERHGMGFPDARVSISGSGNVAQRSEEHTSELQSLMRISYAVFCLKKKKLKTKSIEHNIRNN